MDTYPFLIHYWGSRGGGSRLARETIFEILETSNFHVYTSIRSHLISDLVQSFPSRITNFDPQFQSSGMRLFFDFPRKRRVFISYKKFLLQHNLRRLVICMSHPWDISISKRVATEASVYRVIHDIKPHAGDLWPRRLTILRLLRERHVIVLSNFIGSYLSSKEFFLASLSRYKPTVVPDRPPELNQSPMRYVLVAGRGKHYQSMRPAIEYALKFTNLQIVTTVRGRFRVPKSKRVTRIQRWLTDAELEYLVSNASLMLCLYSEASQSGLVEQAKYWGIPIVVSSEGALPEQVQDRFNCRIVDRRNKTEIAEAIQFTLQQKKLPINHNSQATLNSVLLDVINAFL